MDITYRLLQSGRRTVARIGHGFTGVAICSDLDTPEVLLGIAVAIFKGHAQIDAYTKQLLHEEQPKMRRAWVTNEGVGKFVLLYHQYHMERMARQRMDQEDVESIIRRVLHRNHDGQDLPEAEAKAEGEKAMEGMRRIAASRTQIGLAEKYAREWLRCSPIVNGGVVDASAGTARGYAEAKAQKPGMHPAIATALKGMVKDLEDSVKQGAVTAQPSAPRKHVPGPDAAPPTVRVGVSDMIGPPRDLLGQPKEAIVRDPGAPGGFDRVIVLTGENKGKTCLYPEDAADAAAMLGQVGG